MVLVGIPCLAQANGGLHFEKEVVLPNVVGRIDHLSADTRGQRLFICALGNGTLEVVDLRKGERIHEISGLKEPQGVLYEPASNRIFVASGGDGTLRAYDANSFTFLKSAVLGDDADNVRYDVRQKRVWVGYGDGGLASFDTDLNKVTDIRLPSHPESFQLEQNGRGIFVNLPKSSAIAEVDSDRGKLTDTWPQKSAAANFPMTLDEQGKRLYVGFRNPPRLIVFNTDDGKQLAEGPIVGDTDDLFYDKAHGRIYVIGGEGFIDIFHCQGDHCERVSRISTRAGARTGLFVPALNRLFVAAPRRGTQPAKLLVYRVQ